MYGVLWFGEAVVCVLGIARDLDEAAAPQVGEMPRHERLRQVEQLDEITHAQLPGGEEIQNPQPCRISEPAEQRFEVGDGGSGNSRSHGRLYV